MELTLFVALAVGVVAGLTQMAKAAHFPDRFAPLLEVALGVAFTVYGVQSGAVIVAASVASAALFWSVLYGVIVGLSAGGLYVYAKAAREAVT